jgi:CO/xanthine dehydrogenase FAD-binding subunit
MINPHPGLPEFEYIKPVSLAEASRFLAEHPGESRPFLGGTDTFVRMRDGAWKTRYLVDIKGLDGTDAITFEPSQGLTIGAAINMNRVISSQAVNEFYPLLAEAARTVASFQLRTRATIVGNICNASPAGDTIGACMALGGVLHVFNLHGGCQVPLTTFFRGPGRNSLDPGDIVTAISFPVPPRKCAGSYIKVGRNTIGDLAIVGVTAFAYPDATKPSGMSFKVVLASVAPVPLEVIRAEEILAEQPVTADTIASAAQAAMDACSPIDDVRGSARYRKFMVRNMTARALTRVWDEIRVQ